MLEPTMPPPTITTSAVSMRHFLPAHIVLPILLATKPDSLAGLSTRIRFRVLAFGADHGGTQHSPLRLLPCPLHHFYQDISGLRRTTHFPHERDTSTANALLGLESNVEAESIDRSNGCLLRLDAGENSRQQDNRLLVVAIHVLHDAGCSVRQRVG